MKPETGPAFFFLGASHHTAPLALREKLALTSDKIETFRAALAGARALREWAVVNTCNRIEFYGVAESAAAVDELERTFCQFQGIPPETFDSVRQHVAGRRAIEHLIEVSAGLDSQMLGETEILGQVKEAYAAAQARQTAGPVLNRVFQKTFQHAKYIRSHTAITEGNVSVANIAVELARKIFGDLGSMRILVLGAGEIGEKTAVAFRSRGAKDLTVSSRTAERAMELARTLDAAALPFENVPNHLVEFDIVVTSTAAPTAILTKNDVSNTMRKRRARPLFFIDLALPRDVEASVSELENVFLYNLDDLAKIAEENRHAREAEVKRARALAAEKAEALWRQIEPNVPGSIGLSIAEGSKAPLRGGPNTLAR